MSFLGMVIVFGILCCFAYAGVMLYFRAHAARMMMGEECPYTHESTDYTKTLLVLGDSTGAGVGADSPQESVAGRLAAYMGATHTENYAVSGAAVSDLKAQIDKASLNCYDTILIQIGGNDIILFHDARSTAQKLDVLMMGLPSARQTILMCAGNVGGATIFPWVVRPFHTWTNLVFHRWFSKVAKRRHALYVNLYEPRNLDPFIQEPERYLSKDGLHPSSEGYAAWFEKIQQALETSV